MVSYLAVLSSSWLQREFPSSDRHDTCFAVLALRMPTPGRTERAGWAETVTRRLIMLRRGAKLEIMIHCRRVDSQNTSSAMY